MYGYCERHLAVGIEIPAGRRLAGWPICEDCFNGIPITLVSIKTTLEAGRHQVRPRGRPSFKIDSFDLAEEYEAGSTLTQLAIHYHCSIGCVVGRLEWMGIMRRPKGRPRKRAKWK
jgi:hypothetical protein